MRSLASLWRRRRNRYLTIGLSLALAAALCLWLTHPRPTEPIDSYAACARAGYPILDSEPPACVAHGHTFVGPRDTPAPSIEAVTSQDFQLLVDGDSGDSYPRHQEVLTSPAEWQHYWSAVHAGLKSLPPLIPVDFATSNVVALSEGQQLTSGYSLKITAITSNAKGTTIETTEQVPGITCKVSQTATNRYYIVRTAKLPEPISFHNTREVRDCSNLAPR